MEVHHTAQGGQLGVEDGFRVGAGSLGLGLGLWHADSLGMGRARVLRCITDDSRSAGLGERLNDQRMTKAGGDGPSVCQLAPARPAGLTRGRKGMEQRFHRATVDILRAVASPSPSASDQLAPPARPGLLSLGTVDLLEWAGQNFGTADLAGVELDGERWRHDTPFRVAPLRLCCAPKRNT